MYVYVLLFGMVVSRGWVDLDGGKGYVCVILRVSGMTHKLPDYSAGI